MAFGVPAEWKNLTDGSFKGVTFHYALPSGTKIHGATASKTHSGRRLQVTERPNVDGGRVRDFGQKAREHRLEVIFFGDNASQDFEAFRAVLNQGTAGKLILPTLPQAVNAYFSDLEEASQVGDGGCINVSITWIEDNSSTQTQSAATIATAKSGVVGALAAVGSALSNNPFLQAVQTTNSALSTVRSVVNAVLTLQQGVQNQIIALQANITGTIALVRQGIEAIDSVFGVNPNNTATNTVPQAVVDPVTGLPFASVNTAPPASAPSPFTPPPVASTVNIPIQNTDNPIGAQALIAQLTSTLQGQSDSLISLCGSRTTDVHKTLISLINSLNEYSTFVQPAPVNLVQVLRPSSLAEILFFNQGTVDSLQATYQKNPWIDDPLVIPAGSVVTI